MDQISTVGNDAEVLPLISFGRTRISAARRETTFDATRRDGRARRLQDVGGRLKLQDEDTGRDRTPLFGSVSNGNLFDQIDQKSCWRSLSFGEGDYFCDVVSFLLFLFSLPFVFIYLIFVGTEEQVVSLDEIGKITL